MFVSASYVASAQAPLTAADYPAKMKQAVQANVEVQKALKAGAVADAAAAAAKGDLMAAQMAAGNATANCKQCHGLYREGDPQSGFKFKAGAVN